MCIACPINMIIYKHNDLWRVVLGIVGCFYVISHLLLIGFMVFAIVST